MLFAVSSLNPPRSTLPIHIVDDLLLLVRTGKHEKATETLDRYLRTHSLEAGWDLLTDLNANYKKERLSAFEEKGIDNLWLKLAAAFLSQGNFSEPTKILIEGLGTEDCRLHLQGAVVNLLKMIVENHLKLNDWNAVKSIIDAVRRAPEIPLGFDFLTDEVINLASIDCAQKGFITEAVELSAKKSTLHDQGQLLIYLVQESLKKRNIRAAEELADAIPNAPFLTPITPRSIDPKMPYSHNRNYALRLISGAKSSL